MEQVILRESNRQVHTGRPLAPFPLAGRDSLGPVKAGHLLKILTVAFAVGCGGNGGSNPSPIRNGLYQGVATISGIGGDPTGPLDTVADFSTAGETFIGIRGTGFSASISSEGRQATMVLASRIATGTLRTERRGDGGT
jgi:hypothetical protein